MFVCAHGNVSEYCEPRDMEIVDTWDGQIVEYDGKIPVLVTGCDISEAEYYYLKGVLLARGYELISTRYTDEVLATAYLVCHNAKRGGRQRFNDAVVIQKIRELRAKGLTLRAIRDSEGIRHSDGRKLSLSTIQNLINEKE